MSGGLWVPVALFVGGCVLLVVALIIAEDDE